MNGCILQDIDEREGRQRDESIYGGLRIWSVLKVDRVYEDFVVAADLVFDRNFNTLRARRTLAPIIFKRGKQKWRLWKWKPKGLVVST